MQWLPKYLRCKSDGKPFMKVTHVQSFNRLIMVKSTSGSKWQNTFDKQKVAELKNNYDQDCLYFWDILNVLLWLVDFNKNNSIKKLLDFFRWRNTNDRHVMMSSFQYDALNLRLDFLLKTETRNGMCDSELFYSKCANPFKNIWSRPSTIVQL